MQINYKTGGIFAIVLVAVLAGAYMLGRQQGQEPVTSTRPLPKTGSAVPGHPPAGQPAQADREGRVKVDTAQKFTHFRVGNKNVKSIYADGKVLWVGTSGGVIRYDTATEAFKLYDTQNGLLSNGIFYVGNLQKKLAVGTYGGGLSLLNPADNTWETYNIPEGLGDAFVYDVLETDNGDVWIATWSGVNRIRGGKLKDRSQWELHTVESTGGGLPNDWVYGLAKGRNGDVWLATEGGLALYRNGKWTNWNHKKGMGAPFEKVKDSIKFNSDPSKYSLHHAQQKQEMGLQDIQVAYNPNYIVAIRVDKEGTVWAGTWGAGLARYNGSEWINYTVAEGLPGNHVFMLHLDRQGQLWIGTDGGLAQFKNGKFQVYSKADGLFSDPVFSMTTSDDGDLWVGSYGGVAQIRKSAIR